VEGAPATKTANGKIFNWCAKCNCWTTTHHTSLHTDGASKRLKQRLDSWRARRLGTFVTHPHGMLALTTTSACMMFEQCLAPAYSPIFYEFIVGIIYAQGVKVIAPLCWLIVLFITCGWGCFCFRMTTLSLAGNVKSATIMAGIPGAFTVKDCIASIQSCFGCWVILCANPLNWTAKMLGRIFIASWANFSIISTCLE
jgi:hypothetical protein